MIKLLKKTLSVFLLLIGLIFAHICAAQNMQKPIYQNKKFTLYLDSVVQDSYTTKALSSTALISNYESQANLFIFF